MCCRKDFAGGSASHQQRSHQRNDRGCGKAYVQHGSGFCFEKNQGTGALQYDDRLPGTLSFRNQPNHPTDDVEGIIASIKEGLSYGSGDAVLGVNPVEDNIENYTRVMTAINDLRNKYEIPTQTCVLAHVTTQMQALEKGVPVDLVFQSIAGTQSALEAFGVTVNMLDEAFGNGAETWKLHRAERNVL